MEGREGGTTFTACACSLLLLFHLHLLLLKQVTLSGPPRHLWKKGMKILFCCPLSRNIRQRDATAVTKPALRVVTLEQGVALTAVARQLECCCHHTRGGPVQWQGVPIGVIQPPRLIGSSLWLKNQSISRRAERKQSEIDAAALPLHEDAFDHPGCI